MTKVEVFQSSYTLGFGSEFFEKLHSKKITLADPDFKYEKKLTLNMDFKDITDTNVILDKIYVLLNMTPEDLRKEMNANKCRSLSMGDVIRLDDKNNYYVDGCGFTKID